MSRLVKEACTLRFAEDEFVEFFGIASPLDEDDCSYSYPLRWDGLSLEFTIYPLDGSVHTSLFRDGIIAPIFTSRLRGCTHSRFMLRGSRRFLEIGRPDRLTSEPTAPLVWGLRLFVEPHFAIELIHDSAA